MTRRAAAAPALAAALVLLLHAGAAQARTVAYGVAIGNDAPPAASEVALPVLAYADDDAVRYWQLFSRFCDRAALLSVLDGPTGKRYPEALAAARAPSLSELRSVLADFATRMEADRARGDQPVLYFAFSGHGARGADGSLFLALADAGLTRELLYEEVLRKVPAAFVHLFVDACHAEGVVGARGAPGPESDAKLEPVGAAERQRFLEAATLAQFPHVGVVLATAADQQAHEWSQVESGVFTHELLSGLSGAADVNGDGAIEYSEVQAFLAASNRDVKDERAVPRVVAVPPRLNPGQPIVSVAAQPGTAQLAGVSRLGHFHVELDSGQRYLDANLSPDYVARIAVPAGHLFLVAQDREAELTARAGEIVRFEKLQWRRRSVAARGSVEASLRSALFQSAYGPVYYRGWVEGAGVAGVGWDPSVRLVLETGQSRRPFAVGSFVLGGVALAFAGASAAVAVQAKQDFDATDLQRPASEARDRVVTWGSVAAAAGTVAVAAVVAGWLLWPGADDEVVLAPAVGPGQAGVALRGSF